MSPTPQDPQDWVDAEHRRWLEDDDTPEPAPMDYAEYRYECGCALVCTGELEIDGAEAFEFAPECPLHNLPIPLRVLADMKRGCRDAGIIDRSGQD